MEIVERKQFKSMRRTIGALVLGLPIFSILFGFIGAALGLNGNDWWGSISATYWCNSKVIMISFIAICSYFFMTYPGYDLRDRIVNIISGITLALILIFPCGNSEFDSAEILFCVPENVSGTIHNISALVLFVSLFINVFFLFTLGNGEITEQKKKRNKLYRICGLAIVPVAAVIISLDSFFGIGFYNSVWLAEAIALIPCGIAWLVKGEALKYFND